MRRLACGLGPLPIDPMTRISPSTYSSFRLCSLKEIWTSNRRNPLLPSHPSQKLGTIIHAMLEVTMKGIIKDKASFNVKWDEIINQVHKEMLQNSIEKHLVPLETSAGNYDVKKILAFKLAEQIFDTFGPARTVKKRAEQWLETVDGKIGGKIDIVLHHEFGIEIVDFKTGKVLKEDTCMEIKEEYKEQIKLYAGLYHEVNDVWPVKLSLIGIDRQKYDIPFSQDECKDLLENAKKLVNETNELIKTGLKSEDFANPAPAVCKYCSYRPACKKYWQSRDKLDEWPNDTLGEVKEKRLLGNGFYRLLIVDNEKHYVIRGLSAERHKFLNNDIKAVLFCNLGKDLSDGHYVEQLLTTGYQLDYEKNQ